jgi:hypothetical protein
LWPLENWIGRVNTHEHAGFESFLEDSLPATRAGSSEAPPKRNYWQALRTCSRKSLESITKPDRAPDKNRMGG